MAVNSALLKIAQDRIWAKLNPARLEKSAVVPPMAPPDPAAGGMPPQDPNAGAAPPPDPSMGQMPPPPQPGMSPDPSQMAGPGGMPNLGAFDPTGGMGGPPPSGQPMMPMGQMAPQKLKPEDMFRMLQFQVYNLQQQLTAIMNAMGVQVAPSALILPPGSGAPAPETAMPGGPQDPAMQPQGQDPNQGQPAGNSAIQQIQPLQGASPELAQGQPAGPQQKQGQSIQVNAAATASLLRSRIARARSTGA